MKMQFKTLILFSSFFFSIFRLQLTYSDDVPFIYQTQETLKDFSTTSKIQATIDYSSKNFQSNPEIVTGIIKYDNQWNPDKNGIQFEIISENINKQSCIVKVNEGYNTLLFGIIVKILVLDTSQFPFLQVIHIQKPNIFSGQSTFIYDEEIQFSPTIQSINGVKKVEIFLRGWKSSPYPSNPKPQLTISVKVLSISSSGYKIQFASNQKSQQIVDIYYTIVEYIEDPNSIFGLMSYQDIQYESTQFKNEEKVTSFQVKDMPITGQYPRPYLNLFTGINKFDFQTTGVNSRIELIKIELTSPNTIQYKQHVWHDTVTFGSLSSSLFFYKKYCQDSHQKLKGNICYDCNDGEFFLQDKKLCQSTLPSSYYCKTDKTYQTCKPCSSYCLKCDLNQSNELFCTECKSGHYIYNGNCTIDKPDNTFCNTDFNCVKCSDPQCKSCNDPATNFPQQCDSCKNNEYLYKGKCQTAIELPDNIFCNNSTYKCDTCRDLTCKRCTNPNSPPELCESCFSGNVLENGKCQANNQFCEINNGKYVCVPCTDQFCKTCEDPKIGSKCLTCNTNDILYNGKCYQTNNLPDNTFCDFQLKICVPCNQQACQKCLKEINTTDYACEQCKSGLFLFEGKCYSSDSLPDKTYCDQTSFQCKMCENLLCKRCLIDLKECTSCIDNINLTLTDSTCRCKENGQYYDQAEKTCKQCQSNCIECEGNPNKCTSCGQNAILNQSTFICECQANLHFNELKDCQYCTPNQRIEHINGISTCVCLDNKSYYNPIIKDCVKCKFSNCKKCYQDGSSCAECEDGYTFKDTQKQSCRYCGGGLYSDNQYKCSNQCIKDCILCSNNQTCDKYSDEHIYTDSDCHISCSTCRTPGKQYDCVTCSSSTRTLEALTGTCQCKSGYSESGEVDCKENSPITVSESLQTASANIVKVSYLLYLPQLLLNIHPFSDSFILSIQQAGNLYFSYPNDSIIPFKSLTILNFFNIQYMSEEQNSDYSEYVFGIKYKSYLDKQISYNLLILGLLLTIFAIFAIIICLLRNKLTGNFLIRNLLWNGQMKLIRLSSNYILVNLFLNTSNFSDMNPLSLAILGWLLAIYIVNIVICLKKSQFIDEDNFRFLYSNLNTQIPFHRYFWLILELKKFILVVSLSFISIKLYPYLLIGISFLFTLLLGKFKPFQYCLRDCLYLIVSELFIMIISIYPLIILQSNDYSQQSQMINFANVTIIVYVAFQMLISAEYLVRMVLKRRSEQSLYKMKSNSQKPIVMDMSHEINFENLDDFLNQSSKLRNSFFKKKKNTIITTKSTNGYI